MSERENISALLADTRNVSRVKSLQFGVMSPEEILRASVVEVTIADTYDGTQPKDHGLFDPRMGVIDSKRTCLTDHYDRQICPGHFGHIKLSLPVFWEQFMDVVVKILRCVCVQCGQVLLDKTDPRLIADIKRRAGTGRFAFVYNHIQGQKPHNGALRCQFQGGCMTYQPSKIEKILPEGNSADVNPLTIRATYEKNLFPNQDVAKQFILAPDYVYRLFRRLSDEDVDLFGFSPKFSRPEWFICTILPVCPPSVRPSVRQDDNQRREDDLTCKLADIIKVNNDLKKLIDKNADMKKIAEHHGALQYNVATYVNNEITRIPQATRRSGSPLKTFRQRLSGKEGRIRTNLMGKRVNFSARTVITIDANLSIEQWGVPRKIAMNLTIPDIVTEWNREEMLELVRRGPNVHPGAKSVTKMNYDDNGVPHPEEWSLRCGDRTRINLEPGDVVMRHVQDGDICMFNRQPSVHRMSMMGHRVKVIDDSTFRFNISVCKPYNADFDGDEMNMHVPQSLQTRYELEWITLVPTQIFHPQGGQGIIALNGFDAVTGMYRFTSSDTPLTKDKVQNLLMVVPFWDGTYEEKDMADGTMWSPAALYSMSLPKFSYKGKNMSYNDNPVEANEVVIKKGKVRKGSVFDGKVLGGSQDAMMKSLAFWYGNWAAKNYIDNTQQLMNEWLASSGMSIGIGDCLTPLDLMGQIKDEVQKGIDNVNQILTQAHHGLFESNLQSDYFFKILELKVKNALTDIDTRVTKLLKKEINPADNRFLQMVACGGRGKFPNFAQSIGIVGQQDTYGSRIHFHFTNRTLPHFTKDDYGAESRGFIIHSFGQGLDPHEYFFVQMAGRNGTIDTAIKSVSADTKILIIENDKPKYTEIGNWIDGLLEVNKDNVERLTEKEQELLQLKQKTLIPTTDSKGNVSWGEITAVTRHDPGEGMFEVKTQSGRSVKVVESKSLIVWDNDTNSFKEVLTSEIKIGDFLPVTMCIPKPSASSTLYTDKETGFKLANDIFIKNNVIPSEIYIASNEFIHGFLSAINLNDCFTEEIANTIVYLYNRIGVFVCIHQQEFNKFKIQVAESKVICNNVVLDPIIEINKLPVENYPKVYDVTVPSTLNFGLANGLQVRDTADVGYIQRRLIKAMEDISVMYDLTVRSAAKTIIQFRYGDDGYDGMTLQKQKLELFEKTSTQLRADYEIVDTDWSAWEKMLVGETKKLWKTKSVQEKEVAQKAFQELVESQETLRGKDYRFVNSIDFCSTLNCPVHFDRLMTKVRDFYPVGGAIELFPSDVVQAHNELANELTKFMPDFTLNRFIIQLKSTVSVKRIVVKERWSRAAFTECMRQVREYFMKGLCQPGEMIGTLTAELLGEPLTQMTLNSVDWNTEVLFKMNGRIMKKQIGEWIDEVLPLCSKIENHPNDTVLGYIDTLDVQVPACTENGMIIWDKVQAVTRHPVINPDGSNTLIKVMTRSGREVIATKAKSFLKRVQNKIVGVDGAELKVGDYIPFSKVLDIEEIALSDFSSVVAEYNYLEDYDVIPDVELSSGVQTIYRKNLDKLIMNTKNEDDIQILKSIKRENVYYDEIIEIEEIPSSHQYVYDLTVEKTKNFNIANGLCMRDTFHAAGRADAGLVTTSGVPRMKEIVNLAGKQKQKQIKTPSMKIYLKEPWRSDLNKAKELKPILEFTKLGDLVSQTKILFDPVQNVFSTSPKRPSGVDFEEEDEFTRLYYSFTEAVGYQAPDPSNISPWVLRMEFNRDKMVAHNITMADIRRVLTSNEEINQEITISFSDDNAGELVMRVRVNSIQDDTDPVSFLQLLEHKNLMQVTIQGVPGIIRAFPQKEDTLYYNADGKPEMRSDWIIETEGVNIFEVLMLEFVDAERMMCNDINMIKEIFGIEAARAILIYEFGNLMSGSVPDLNYRHISVVCDVMSYRGDLMSIDRHGLKRSPDISAFAKASNEESVEILVNAGIFADNDRMTGVSSNILMGQQPTGGTNAFELLLDESDLGAGMVEVGVPDYRPSTIYEEVGEATTWGADDDVVEEVVEAAHPEYQGFMGDDPFAVQFEGDRLDRLGRLEVETSVPRPPLFKSTKNWIHMDE